MEVGGPLLRLGFGVFWQRGAEIVSMVGPRLSSVLYNPLECQRAPRQDPILPPASRGAARRSPGAVTNGAAANTPWRRASATWTRWCGVTSSEIGASSSACHPKRKPPRPVSCPAATANVFEPAWIGS